MLKEIVGLRPYEFTDQKTGEVVSGYGVFLQWQEENVNGMACEAVSLKTEKLEGYVPKIGDLVRVGYNKYQKCDFIIKGQ